MLTAPSRIPWFVAFAATVGAQTPSFAERIAAVETAAAAMQWASALDALFALREVARTDVELSRLAAWFGQVGLGLETGSDRIQAPRAHEAALELRRRVHGDQDHAEIATALSNLGLCLGRMRRHAEALPNHVQSLAMQQRLHAEDDASVATSMAHLADCLESMGRLPESLPHYEASLAMRKRLSGGADTPEVAVATSNLGGCLRAMGRSLDALPYCEASLAMRQRLFGAGDSAEVARGMNNLALCLLELGRWGEALPHFEASLAMRQRLRAGIDHADVATALNNLGLCLQRMGRFGEALSRYESALAMSVRLHGDRDDPSVSLGLNRVASCLRSLDRSGEALPMLEQSLALARRLHGNRDHPEVMRRMNGIAGCLADLGRFHDAAVMQRDVVSTWRRLLDGRDHPELATCINNSAQTLLDMGKVADALPQFEAALAMRKRLYPGVDIPDVASAHNNLACCLERLGRTEEALPHYEVALRISRAVWRGRDHSDLVVAFGMKAGCLAELDRLEEALPLFEEACAMARRLADGRGTSLLAKSLAAQAYCLNRLERSADALPLIEEALATRRRIDGDRDSIDMSRLIGTYGNVLQRVGRLVEAMQQFEEALTMHQRLHGDRDHAGTVLHLEQLTTCCMKSGKAREALAFAERAVGMIERLRDDSRLSPELRQSYFDGMKDLGAFERLQFLAARLGDPVGAWSAAERSRSRGLLDLIEGQQFDAMAEVEERARRRGDEATATRLASLRSELDEASADCDRLLHLLGRLGSANKPPEEKDRERGALLAESATATKRNRGLLDERARLLGDVLPVGRLRSLADVQASLRPDELLVEFTITPHLSQVFAVAHTGPVEVLPLPNAMAELGRTDLLRLLPRSGPARGRDPESGANTALATDRLRDLFTALFPSTLWERVRRSRRVFVAAHRALHNVPFELLVTDSDAGRPLHWLDSGPPVSYVPSGSVLHWLRKRAIEVGDDATALDLLAVGDPRSVEVDAEVPADGAFVVAVTAGEAGADAGLRPGDVLVSYDGTKLIDDKSLRDARVACERAIEDGLRQPGPVPMGVWRDGDVLDVWIRSGPLGVTVGAGRARVAFAASLGNEERPRHVTRAGDVERLGELPPLRGARIETEVITQVFATAGLRTETLLGVAATESAVFQSAAKAKYLHFACHGIAEEHAGRSLNLLVLSQRAQALRGNDGLLQLDDLLRDWRSRLSSCRLVVLSACRTNVGPTFRDDSPQGLPVGFLFAGAPTVISTLWAVDDESTRTLMTDFYNRLVAGEADKLKALTDAKKALRANPKYADPFYWAPFLFMGVPE